MVEWTQQASDAMRAKRQLKERHPELADNIEAFAEASRQDFVRDLLDTSVDQLAAKVKGMPIERLLTLPNPREHEALLAILEGMDEGEYLPLDWRMFQQAFTRVDSAMEALFGPTRSPFEVFAEEQPDFEATDLIMRRGSVQIKRIRRKPKYVLPEVQPDLWLTCGVYGDSVYNGAPFQHPGHLDPRGDALSYGQERIMDTWIDNVERSRDNTLLIFRDHERHVSVFERLEEKELMFCSGRKGSVMAIHFTQRCIDHFGINVRAY